MNSFVSLIVKTALFCRFALPILPALRSKTLNIAGGYYMVLVARQAPDFTAAAVLGSSRDC